MPVDDFDIGSKIRAYRRKKNLSLMRLSELTGIAASNLSSIELGKSSPTLSTLLKIATAFETKVTAFLDEVLYQNAVLCPPLKASKFLDGVDIVSLTAGIPLRSLEARIVRLGAGHRESIDDSGDCFVYCLDGAVEIETEQNKFRLDPGYSVYLMFEAKAVIENNGDVDASVSGGRANGLTWKPA